MTPAEPAAQLACTQPGTILGGKYRVEELIGAGGMGVVVRARHLVLDEVVAIKFLRPAFAAVPEWAARFLREAKVALRIRSEHVPKVLDVGALESGEPFMVLEHLEGRDLADLVKRGGPLPVEIAVDFMIQACRGLADAHVQGVIHRDLKPSNLFVTQDAQGRSVVKILDFGISKVMGDVDDLTKTDAMMGSALYMSPEQLQSSKDVDARSDVYSLGVSLYEILARKRPFEAPSIPLLVAQILTADPVRLDEVRPDVPRELADVVHHAIARERTERVASATALAQELSAFATERGRLAAAGFAKVDPTEPRAEPRADRTGPTAPDVNVVVAEPPQAGSMTATALATTPAPRLDAGDKSRSRGWVWLAAAAIGLAGTTAFVLTRGPSNTAGVVSNAATGATSAALSAPALPTSASPTARNQEKTATTSPPSASAAGPVSSAPPQASGSSSPPRTSVRPAVTTSSKAPDPAPTAQPTAPPNDPYLDQH